MNRMIKLVVTDDHKIFAQSLKNFLSGHNHIDVLRVLHDGKELISFLENHEVDVVLLDINMPEMDGMDAAHVIYHRFPKVKVVMLTMYNNNTFVKKVMSKGAQGYVMKNADPEELLLAIETVYSGKKYLSKHLQQNEKEENKNNTASDFDDNYNNKLSKREKEILSLIATGKSNTEIANELFLSPHTVDTHRKNIMSKLDVHNVTDLVKYAIQIGLA